MVTLLFSQQERTNMAEDTWDEALRFFANNVHAVLQAHTNETASVLSGVFGFLSPEIVQRNKQHWLYKRVCVSIHLAMSVACLFALQVVLNSATHARAMFGYTKEATVSLLFFGNPLIRVTENELYWLKLMVHVLSAVALFHLIISGLNFASLYWDVPSFGVDYFIVCYLLRPGFPIEQWTQDRASRDPLLFVSMLMHVPDLAGKAAFLFDITPFRNERYALDIDHAFSFTTHWKCAPKGEFKPELLFLSERVRVLWSMIESRKSLFFTESEKRVALLWLIFMHEPSSPVASRPDRELLDSKWRATDLTWKLVERVR